MATRTNPTLAGMRLGTTLAEWRRKAGKSTRDAGGYLECTHQKIGHIEAARNKISVSELRDLCAFYQVPPDAAAEMEAMRQASALPRWWSKHRLPRWLADYVGLEDAATVAREVALEVIPGLLQAEEYVNAQRAMPALVADQTGVERAASVRLVRQHRLSAEADPLRLEAVVSEAALRRALGDPRVGMVQIKHLIEMARRPNVELHILPFSAGLHMSMTGSFSLLDFDTEPSVGYQEYAVGGHIVDDREAVDHMLKIWFNLRAQALDVDESLRFLAEVTGEPDGEVDKV